MVDALYAEKLHSRVNVANQNVPYLPISFQPPILPPPVLNAYRAKATQKQVIPSPSKKTEQQQEPSADPERASPKRSDSNNNEINEDSIMIDSHLDIKSDYIFHNEYYLTSVRANDSKKHISGIHTEVQKWLKFGRPDMKEIFERVSELCKDENIPRVGVCVCGPPSMINDVVDVCNKSLSDPRCGQVRFDCHSEIFDF